MVNASFNDFSPWKVLTMLNRAHPNFLKAMEFLSFVSIYSPSDMLLASYLEVLPLIPRTGSDAENIFSLVQFNYTFGWALFGIMELFY